MYKYRTPGVEKLHIIGYNIDGDVRPNYNAGSVMLLSAGVFVNFNLERWRKCVWEKRLTMKLFTFYGREEEGQRILMETVNFSFVLLRKILCRRMKKHKKLISV